MIADLDDRGARIVIARRTTPFKIDTAIYI
jgi:hypothetical protein